MQTTKFIYLIMWAFFIVPLLGFNIKRLSSKKHGEKRKIKWGFIAFIAVLVAFITVFLVFAYNMTINTRYELAAERYVDLHAQYATGKLTYDEYISKSSLLQTPDADTAAFIDTLTSAENAVPKSLRFQISNWITPKYYQEYKSFPTVEAIDSENPVFVLYLFDEGSPLTVADDESTQFYYLIEMVWNDDGGWKIAYQAPATEEQRTSAKTSLPSQINGKWFSFSA